MITRRYKILDSEAGYDFTLKFFKDKNNYHETKSSKEEETIFKLGKEIFQDIKESNFISIMKFSNLEYVLGEVNTGTIIYHFCVESNDDYKFHYFEPGNSEEDATKHTLKYLKTLKLNAFR